MKKSNKKIIILIFVFFIIILISVSIILANNSTSKTNFKIDKEKIYYQIKYFDYEIIDMMELLNNVNSNANFYIEWKELQLKIENLYIYWNSAILDLNYLDVNKNNLTDFGRILDELRVSIKNLNKENTLNNLLKLYNNLIIYSQALEYNKLNEILSIKYNLLLSYSIAEQGNWTVTHEYILKSSQGLYNIVNSLEDIRYNQYNINQAFIAVKELENIINIKDLDVFYLKYKIAIDKLNIL